MKRRFPDVFRFVVMSMAGFVSGATAAVPGEFVMALGRARAAEAPMHQVGGATPLAAR